MNLITLTGPSCSGKTTLLNKLVETGDYFNVVSHTTRSARFSEINGIDYYFVSNVEFKTKLSKGDFIEHIEFNDTFYGVSLDEIKKAESINKIALVIVEPKGLQQIRAYSSKYSVSLYSIYIDADVNTSLSRYITRCIDDFEDYKKQNGINPTVDSPIILHHAKRIQSLVKEHKEWYPEVESLDLSYNMIIDELNSETIDEVISKIKQIKNTKLW